MLQACSHLLSASDDVEPNKTPFGCTAPPSSAGEFIRVLYFLTPSSIEIANCVSLAENVHRDTYVKRIPSIAGSTVRFCHKIRSALIERVRVLIATATVSS
mmetsp:Transcript_26803/g.60141  ORF Transcript_26803/g.60141 Transcript_26803/m.60141 type:complete len:101 (-) Transcript_26803:845-1147(-)